MKLYLSSFRNGNRPQELLKLIGNNKRVAVISNAKDYDTEAARQLGVNEEIERLQSLGLSCTEIDLRDYFDKSGELTSALEGYGLLWVRGGNCFILRRAFRQSGLERFLPQWLEDEKIVYGGYSAGIDMLTPSLHGAELVDDPHVVPQKYHPEIIWDCLNLLPFSLAPHYKSNHPESADIDKSIDYMINQHIPFIALRDGEAIIRDGNQQFIVS